MEQFKIEHFREENHGVAFPNYKPLSKSECEKIRLQVCAAFGFPASLDGASLAIQIVQLQSCVEGVNAENEDFDLKAIAESIGIRVRENVFVNWNQFDNIDEFSFENLAKFFNDIWYPSSDDIDIVDPSFSWILSVNHDGGIQVYRL